MATDAPAKQLLHLVFGGELTDLGGTEFKDLDKIDMVGVFPNYATAYTACASRSRIYTSTTSASVRSYSPTY